MKKEEGKEIYGILRRIEEDEETQTLEVKLKLELLGLMAKAQLAVGKQDWKTAIKLLKEAIELEPDRLPLLWLTLGSTYLKVEMHEKALVCFDRVLELDQKNGEAWYNKGIILEKIWGAMPFEKRKSYGEADAIKQCFHNAVWLAQESKNQELLRLALKALKEHEDK